MASKNPSKQDRKNYSYHCIDSPFFNNPEKFLKKGQRVKAKFRIFDNPNNSQNWGLVHAEAGEEGTVVHVEQGLWPTVTFDRTGTTTNVTDFEVEPLKETDDRRFQLSEFFEGVSRGLLGEKPDGTPGTSPLDHGLAVGQALSTDHLTGEAAGLTVSDYIQVALKERGINSDAKPCADDEDCDHEPCCFD